MRTGLIAAGLAVLAAGVLLAGGGRFAHDVLTEAAPALRRRGCDVSALL